MKRHYRPSRSYHDGAAYKRFKDNSSHILPIFEPSGILEMESHANSANGSSGNNDDKKSRANEAVTFKYIEPPNAISPYSFWEKFHEPIDKRPMIRGILYKADKEELVSEYNLELRSSYIIGREPRREDDTEPPDGDSSSEVKNQVIANIKIPDPGCSRQHCVIQFLEKNDTLIPYIMDLDSTNGTTLNGILLPSARYVELRSEDIVRFSAIDADSEYELVFMWEG